MSKITTLAQLRAAVEKAKGYTGNILVTVSEALDELASALAGKADLATFATVSIPTGSWVTNTDYALKDRGFDYMADIAVTGVAATDGLDATVAKVSQEAARAAGVADTAETLDGAVRFYAVSVPTAEISIQIQIIEGGT